ncbi:hypothetical protein BDZ91DRAFT_711981 [Kalaharituber pfeilii]|nr:hypothetical protein BDZ91DRAFT_711981 [Kalaharituber pfeilii]
MYVTYFRNHQSPTFSPSPPNFYTDTTNNFPVLSLLPTSRLKPLTTTPPSSPITAATSAAKSASASPAFKLRPTPLSIGLFTTAFLISGFITYDGAKVDGAGTTSAWSILYLISPNTKHSLSPLRILGRPSATGGIPLGLWGRLAPAGLVGLVAFNAVTHGWVWWKGDGIAEEGKYKGRGGWAGDI